MFANAAVHASVNVIPFAPPRRAEAAAPQPIASPPISPAERRDAIERLRAALPEGSIVYVTRRCYHPDNDWLICDFFRIQGHIVSCITRDVAIAIDRYDPEREVGVRLHRPRRADPLTVLIDGTLSRLLHGEPGAVQHVVIG